MFSHYLLHCISACHGGPILFLLYHRPYRAHRLYADDSQVFGFCLPTVLSSRHPSFVIWTCGSITDSSCLSHHQGRHRILCYVETVIQRLTISVTGVFQMTTWHWYYHSWTTAAKSLLVCLLTSSAVCSSSSMPLLG